MVRKLVVEEWISLDGYVSDRNGKLDFFTSSVGASYDDKGGAAFLNSIDCILFGRKTYQQFASRWPTIDVTKLKRVHGPRVIENLLQSARKSNSGPVVGSVTQRRARVMPEVNALADQTE